MNYNNIFNTALSYTSDTDEMKAFLIREYKKAEREFYTIDSFYNGLLKTVTQKRKLIEKAFNKEVENLEQTIKDIDKYTFCPQATEKRLSDYSNEELEAYQTEARKKLLVSAQSKLKNISISYFQNNIAPLASIELFEQTIKELFKISQEQNNTIEIEQASTNPTDKQQSKYSNLTVLQWGAIFHYADTTNLLPKSKSKIAKLTAFIEKHKIETTLNHLKIQYYKANNQINKYNNYPIEKLEEIIPFLKQHYKQTVERVKNDIELLQEYKDEYE